MPHPYLHRCSRFPLILLLCGLLWSALGHVSFAADLTASSSFPKVNFDDTDTTTNPDWIIFADGVSFDVIDAKNGPTPFRIFPNAPSNSIVVRNTGAVGLGTSAPAQKLHLVTGINPAIRLEQNASMGFPARTWDLIANQINFFLRDETNGHAIPFLIQAGAPHFALFVAADGRVGLGTGFPQGNLHIVGQANQDLFSGIGPDLNAGPAFNFGYSGFSFGPGSGFFNVRGATSGVNPSLRFATVNQQRMIITNNGRVGIGTLAPAQPLHVSGNIRTDGSFIAGGTTLNVPDYVFAPDYKLLPLSDLASYVEKEKHLPDIPSAQEIKTQGVNVSELQMQLLKKVEELTLYVIAQEKINKAQEQKIQQLTARLTTMGRTRKK